MRKLLFITVLFIYFSDFLYAQTEFGSSLSFAQSYRKGYVLMGNTDAYIGYSLALYSETKVKENLYFQPELHYVHYKYYSDQIQVPILAKYKFAKKFSVFGGPNFGFLLGHDPSTNDTFNFALTFGLSYQISKRFSVDARYNYGISRLHQIDIPEYSMRLSSFMIGLRYQF